MKLSVTAELSRGLPDRGRLDQEPKDKLDLNRLRARLGERPRTKAGQVRQAWPDIKALFEAGHSLKDIWTWLNEIGIEIGYARLSHYTGQLRRRDRAAAKADSVASGQGGAQVVEHRQPAPVEGEPAELRQDENLPPPSADPLANIREREGRHSGFQYNPDPDIKKLI